MPPAGADINRKRPSEEAADNNRLQKRRSQGFTAPSSNSASAGESDLTALISVADASRRYDEWKGDIGDGVYRTLTGGGAYFPTNYKLFLKHPAPWLCPLVDCRKSFAQCSSLGHHFSKAHRGVKLYDDAERGLFHPQGKRIKPDKDGKLRPIVVARGFGAPGEDRQAPAALAANRPATDNSALVRPLSTQVASAAAPTPTTARTMNSSSSAPIIPAQAARPLSRKVIDISNDDEGVNPVVRDTSVRNIDSCVSAHGEQANGVTKITGAANRVRKNGHSAVFEVSNPQELGGAQHHRNLFASWEQEAGAQRRKKISSKTGREVPKRQPKDASSNASQKVGTQHLEDTLSTPSSEDDDDSDPFRFESSDPPVLPKNATQQQRPGNDTSSVVLADSKRLSEPNKSAIWRYLMTLTKTDMPVPDDPAITELLTLPKQRNLPRTWQRQLSKFVDFQLNTLTGLILYIGGDEASNSPCKWMGCSIHAEAHVFWEINFYYGNSIDHRYPFPKCVFLPNHLRDSVSVTERLGHHLCCNAYHRSWKKPPHWVNTVPNEKPKAARDPERVEVMRNTSTEESAGTGLSASIPSNTRNSATSPSQAPLPACSPLQPATMVRDTATPRNSTQQSTSRSPASQVSQHVSAPPSSTTRNEEEKSQHFKDFSNQGQSSRIGTSTSTIFSQLAVAMQQTVSPRRVTQAQSAQRLVAGTTEIEPKLERSPGGSESGQTGENNSETLRSGYDKEEQGLKSRSQEKSHLWINDVRRKIKEKKMRRKARRQQEGQAGARQYSPIGQARATVVSVAAASLSNLTIQDTSTAPSRSPQQGGPEQSQKTTVFNLASGSTQSIGFKGEESQLLQASKRQTLDCTVWAGSVRIKMIGNGGMSITRRVNAEGTWTVGPDSHCLISNFFPAAKETAVVNVKSKSVLTSIE